MAGTGVSMMTTAQTLLSGKVKSRVDEHINCNYHNGAKCQANAFVRAEIKCSMISIFFILLFSVVAMAEEALNKYFE